MTTQRQRPSVAVAFSGQLRGYPSLWVDIRARLITPNSADVYAAFWREREPGYPAALQCFQDIMQPMEVAEVAVLNRTTLAFLAGGPGPRPKLPPAKPEYVLHSAYMRARVFALLQHTTHEILVHARSDVTYLAPRVLVGRAATPDAAGTIHVMPSGFTPPDELNGNLVVNGVRSMCGWMPHDAFIFGTRSNMLIMANLFANLSRVDHALRREPTYPGVVAPERLLGGHLIYAMLPCKLIEMSISMNRSYHSCHGHVCSEVATAPAKQCASAQNASTALAPASTSAALPKDGWRYLKPGSRCGVSIHGCRPGWELEPAPQVKLEPAPQVNCSSQPTSRWLYFLGDSSLRGLFLALHQQLVLAESPVMDTTRWTSDGSVRPRPTWLPWDFVDVILEAPTGVAEAWSEVAAYSANRSLRESMRPVSSMVEFWRTTPPQLDFSDRVASVWTPTTGAAVERTRVRLTYRMITSTNLVVPKLRELRVAWGAKCPSPDALIFQSGSWDMAGRRLDKARGELRDALTALRDLSRADGSGPRLAYVSSPFAWQPKHDDPNDWEQKLLDEVQLNASAARRVEYVSRAASSQDVKLGCRDLSQCVRPGYPPAHPPHAINAAHVWLLVSTLAATVAAHVGLNHTSSVSDLLAPGWEQRCCCSRPQEGLLAEGGSEQTAYWATPCFLSSHVREALRTSLLDI